MRRVIILGTGLEALLMAWVLGHDTKLDVTVIGDEKPGRDLLSGRMQWCYASPLTRRFLRTMGCKFDVYPISGAMLIRGELVPYPNQLRKLGKARYTRIRYDWYAKTRCMQPDSYDKQQWERLQTFLDQIYDDFKDKVAKGRGLTAEQVEELARGRIWSGARAKENGLVDELGGMDTALRLAKEEAGIDEDEDVRIVVFPKDEGFLAQLLGGSDGDNSEEHPPNAQTEFAVGLKRWQPVLQRLEAVGLGVEQPGVMMMAPLQIND